MPPEHTDRSDVAAELADDLKGPAAHAAPAMSPVLRRPKM